MSLNSINFQATKRFCDIGYKGGWLPPPLGFSVWLKAIDLALFSE